MPAFFTQLKDVLTSDPAEFFGLFDALSEHAVSCAHRLLVLAASDPASSPECANVHAEEEAADALHHRVVERLSSAVMPPLDVGDALAVADGIDDVVDAMDEVAKRFCLYHVRVVRPEFAEQMRVLAEASETLRDAVRVLRHSRWMSDLRPTLDALGRIETRGDEVFQTAVSRLFDGPTDPLVAIMWHEIFEVGERAIDCCQRAGYVLERTALHSEG